MFSGRKRKKEGFNELDQASARIRQSIQELEEELRSRSDEKIRSGPNVLPPLERVKTNKSNVKLHVAVSKGQVRNRRNEMKDSTFLLLLMVLAIVASIYWVLHLVGVH